ncbi:hypothetical protein LTR56_004995 [Elasticomyces elasticus]|nr:hypothetical protein LTR22_015810 [Elasticomyces elasticus]KAK3652701.1 hypothetical protein LTR56_004995 [Elasticomyces elasticus]KAK4914631.1 hypothetical protein LTR49_017198 [Elasticomyces elasticus]KAK5753997.1 hypothetical protein LTS12_015963 [Elasticomyces elasticus]
MVEQTEANILGLHAQIKGESISLALHIPGSFADFFNTENAVILFPTTETFTVAVTKAGSTYPTGIFSGFYRAHCLANSASAAKGGLKSTVVEALRSLLDTMAVALAAKLEEKTGSSDRGDWVKRGDGEVMEGSRGMRYSGYRSDDY